MRFIQLMNKWINTLLIMAFIALIAIVTLQIIGRFFLIKAPPWTEELSRFVMIYIVALGIGKAARENALIRVDIIDHIINSKFLVVRDIFYKLVCIVFLAICTYYSLILVYNGQTQFAASIHISMNFIFFSIILLNISILLVYIYELFLSINFYKR